MQKIWIIILFQMGILNLLAQIQTDVPALKHVYAKDFYMGCLLSYRHIGLSTDPTVPGQSSVVDPNGGYLILFHMNSMSPGNNMKPDYTLNIQASATAYRNALTQAEKDSIDIHPIVRFNGDLIAQINWAERQRFTFRGHTLVWHNQTPLAFFRSGYTETGPRLSKEKMILRMENYIKEVIRLIHESWPGLVSAIDVVNEAVLDDGQDRTESEWYKTFGDNRYIMKAFEFARKYTIQYGETQMKLYYNDYNTHIPAKADGIVRICTPIFEAGFLDGIGMQEHDGLTYPTSSQWISSYEKFYPICHEMAVTELDVATGYANPSSEILAKQANQYAQLFKCFVERSYFAGRGKIISVSKDGLNDRYTFKTNQSSSLWDVNNQCKPAFFAVVDVGLSYNALDSLLSNVETLLEEEYTEASWADLVQAVTSAREAMGRNYSVNVSAAEALKSAKEKLASAIEALEKKETSFAMDDRDIKYKLTLGPSYPNPFNGSTKIHFTLPQAGHVSLKIYNVRGVLVTNLYENYCNSGNNVVEFDGSGLSSGMYFCKLSFQGEVRLTRLLLIK